MGLLFLLWTVVLIILGKALSQSDVYIDCGSQISYDDWDDDEGYTETGENKAVQLDSSPNSTQLKTLRIFPKHKRNCYALPAEASSLSEFTYLIRASFYYGNYDGHSHPPTFELEVEGMKWATIVTSNTKPQFYELLYYSKKENISVCLVQTKHKQFPFINALELRSLTNLLSFPHDFVDEENTTWLTSYRYSYGADENKWILGYPDDKDDRIWEPNTPAGLKAVTLPSFTSCGDERLPYSVLRQAVEAPNPTDTIDLPFAFNGIHDLQHYVRAYFSSNIDESETRTFSFYINDDYISTITIGYYNCNSTQAYVRSNGTLNVQLRPNGNSALSPFISGIEIYTALPALPAEATEEEKKKKKKNLGLLIGLPVGLILGLILLPGLIILLLILRRPKTRPTQGQAATTGPHEEANPQQSVSSQAPVVPSQNGEILVSSNGNGDHTLVNHGG
ncbi:probable LRR receptor-like serine/threonine-protein kinase At1g05700 [Syzygium oleosum]|uniref:probable LRR receptor-like serine/threonine-protein kinase At1g05700 n=1 Tax=Syzygium oleosum TaxID=219896 RepID=UPI0011D1DFB9|nr:probable LRR receptor-like serine/threonine-protein kinase At1g05700 [Syzygium oleosum]